MHDFLCPLSATGEHPVIISHVAVELKVKLSLISNNVYDDNATFLSPLGGAMSVSQCQ